MSGSSLMNRYWKLRAPGTQEVKQKLLDPPTLSCPNPSSETHDFPSPFYSALSQQKTRLQDLGHLSADSTSKSTLTPLKHLTDYGNSSQAPASPHQIKQEEGGNIEEPKTQPPQGKIEIPKRNKSRNASQPKKRAKVEQAYLKPEAEPSETSAVHKTALNLKKEDTLKIKASHKATGSPPHNIVTTAALAFEQRIQKSNQQSSPIDVQHACEGHCRSPSETTTTVGGRPTWATITQQHTNESLTQSDVCLEDDWAKDLDDYSDGKNDDIFGTAFADGRLKIESQDHFQMILGSVDFAVKNQRHSTSTKVEEVLPTLQLVTSVVFKALPSVENISYAATIASELPCGVLFQNAEHLYFNFPVEASFLQLFTPKTVADAFIEAYVLALSKIIQPITLCSDYAIRTTGPTFGKRLRKAMSSLRTQWNRLEAHCIHQALDDLPWTMPGITHIALYHNWSFPFASPRSHEDLRDADQYNDDYFYFVNEVLPKKMLNADCDLSTFTERSSPIDHWYDSIEETIFSRSKRIWSFCTFPTRWEVSVPHMSDAVMASVNRIAKGRLFRRSARMKSESGESLSNSSRVIEVKQRSEHEEVMCEFCGWRP